MSITIKHRALLYLILIVLVLTFIYGCSGTAEESSKINKITPTEKIFTIDDLMKTGFKKNKTFL